MQMSTAACGRWCCCPGCGADLGPGVVGRWRCCRERNRILARRTRLRKKFFFESLQKQVIDLKRENNKLKEIVKKRMKDAAPALLEKCNTEIPSIVAESMTDATR
jgi:hypothetical protein